MITKHSNFEISDQESEIISDRESEINGARRGRPAVPAAVMLVAADKLFADADLPTTVTMDAIAVAAGVGKGTLFRAFGSREGLLDALWATKILVLRQAVEEGEAPLGPGVASRERAVAFLDALLTFKLENRHLIRAREIAFTGLRQSAHYQWMHGLLRSLIEDAAIKVTADYASYSAHVLLSALHMDLIEDMFATGRTSSEIRSVQAALVRAVIDDARRV